MRVLLAILTTFVMASLAAADELADRQQPVLSMSGAFEVTWTVESSNSHSFRQIADGVSRISLFRNYVMLHTSEGGHLIARDRLIDFQWVGQSTATPSATVPRVTAEAAPIPAAYLKYAAGVFKKYDANEDGALQPQEWAQISGDASPADADGDGKITPEEYARSLMQR